MHRKLPEYDFGIEEQIPERIAALNHIFKEGNLEMPTAVKEWNKIL